MNGGRTAVVGVLVGGAITAVLIGWYRAGMREADREEDALVEQARREARDRADDHAAALATRLETLRSVESARPYFHYQNLFHDPEGASEGLAVVPSPLASGTGDPLIAVHFQIDERGAVTSPSVNDEVPDAVQSKAPDRGGLAALAAAKVALGEASVGGAVAVETGPKVAVIEKTALRPQRAPTVAPVPTVAAPEPQLSTASKSTNEPQPQRVELAPEVYTQNVQSNEIFRANRAPQQLQLLQPNADEQQIVQQAQQPMPAPQQAQAPIQQAPPPPAPKPRPRVRRAPAPPPAPTAPVIVTVAPLTWHTVAIGGEPTLVAVRRVVTPDGERTQGLTVGKAQLAAWLDEREDGTAVLGADPAGAALGLGGAPWTIAIDDRAALGYAHRTAEIFRDSFLMRFVPIAGLAALCGALVVLVTARAERLAQQRARFAAAAAHELRTPLAGIQLYGDMLGEQLGDPTKQRDYAHRISLEAARLGRVVANVLGVSQLERGGLTVRAEPGDIVDAVREAVERSEPGLVRAGATLELVAPATLRARFDRDAVARIVGNLLDNAEKYGREHADRRITVSVATSPDGTEIEIAIRDRGPGLPAAMRRGRFVAFARGADEDAPAGLGLGLALSRALALAMGGSLAPRAVSPGAELVLRVPAA